MADDTLLSGGTLPVDPVVQAITELETHAKSLTAEQRTEFDKLDPAGRITAINTAKQTREIGAYAEKLPAEQKAVFEKLKPEEKAAAVATARQTAAFTEKMTPEQKAEFEKLKPEEKSAKIAEAAKADSVPEAYNFKFPEGFKLDEQDTKDTDKLFRDLGLTQSKAQQLMDKYVATVQKANATQQQQLAAQQKAWRDEFTKDPAHKGILIAAKRALMTLGDKDAQTLFTNSWLGDNPSVLRLLAKAGELIKEDTAVHGQGGAGGATTGKTLAQVIYPDLK